MSHADCDIGAVGEGSEGIHGKTEKKDDKFLQFGEDNWVLFEDGKRNEDLLEFVIYT